MNARWEVHHEGGGRFRVRRRGIGCLRGALLLWFAGLLAAGVAAGVTARLWQRLDRWLWDTTHLTAGTVAGVLTVAALFWWLWRQAERGPGH